MKFHYVGKYNGDENSLPQRDHHPNAVAFKEIKNMKTLALISNLGCLITMIILAIPFIIRGKNYIIDQSMWVSIGFICSLLVLPIHELLHAICFKKDVYYYSNLKQGLLFVVGTEDMSKRRFIFMSLCPNIFLGFIPYILYFMFPHIIFLGAFGIMCIAMGFGDYMNVYNALTQMPKGSKTYLCGMHSYWYLEN